MPITFENLPRDYEQLQVPVFILKGRSSAKSGGLIGVFNDKFPDQFYEVTDGYFKAYLHLGLGINKITLKHLDGSFQKNGYAAFDTSKTPYDKISISVNYSPIPDSQLSIPKIHLCVMIGRDSPALYDCPANKMFEGNGLNTAIKKLRVGGRLMQAFTVDEMNRNGCGKRCFRFVEEETISTISYQDEMKKVKRNEIKIHIIKSKRSVSEIRNANYAQQNSKATEAGKLFDFALEALKDSGGPFSDNSTNQIPALAAVMILDAHWDKSQNLLLGHAALGGGTDRIKLAIFGSQGLHSWPMNWESIHKGFTDCTLLNTDEVVNDCGECSQYWECLCVSLGAFMHEIGHSLGCPHQEHGVMLRDYVTMDRKYLTTEENCIRTKRGKWGPVLTKDEPGWHRLDIIRFLYHPAFALPGDFEDITFRPQFSYANQGMKLPNGLTGEPTFIAFDQDTLDILSETGIYLIECHVGEWSRVSYEYIPQFYQGVGPQRYIRLKYSIIQQQMPNEFKGKPIHIEVLTMGFGQRSIDNLQDYLNKHSQTIKLSNGKNAKMSDKYGIRESNHIECSFPDKTIDYFRISHGSALDGIETHFTDGSIVKFGNTTPNFTDFKLDKDEFVIGVSFRSGAWVDSVQFNTNKRISGNFGGNGGSLHNVPLPTGSKLLGFYGSLGSWIDQIGIYYG
ncbi:hypothetical protein C6P40_003495 [Pichia californica]|uniref:Jacalin-type lectin domain-containing protein n=1 Tax=Pichia californica TaxID=460514 RepID=A0A9P6WQ91_9ASCO|nr:hypothetical protein C6P42_004765 [[Candida] californica]KAG0691244.1 hypothetical protein C6P40_003495 [[Candida] californica]